MLTGACHLAIELGHERGIVEELVIVAEQEFGFPVEVAGNLKKVEAVALAGKGDIHVEVVEAEAKISLDDLYYIIVGSTTGS